MALPALAAAGMLAAEGLDAAAVNARFLKPIDAAMLEAIARDCRLIVTVEEGTVVNGFGAMLARMLAESHPGRAGADARRARRTDRAGPARGAAGSLRADRRRHRRAGSRGASPRRPALIPCGSAWSEIPATPACRRAGGDRPAGGRARLDAERIGRHRRPLSRLDRRTGSRRDSICSSPSAATARCCAAPARSMATGCRSSASTSAGSGSSRPPPARHAGSARRFRRGTAQALRARGAAGGAVRARRRHLRPARRAQRRRAAQGRRRARGSVPGADGRRADRTGLRRRRGGRRVRPDRPRTRSVPAGRSSCPISRRWW